MLRSFDFCLPTRSTTVPDGEDWLHEVKYDGYRLQAERDGDPGAAHHPWRLRADQTLPGIVEAALKNR
jgi:ATP-dependent DNA ligase